MDTETKIYVNNDLGIVMARMQTRDVARQMGFSTADQARISLAASELARVMSWITHSQGELVISNARRNGHQGLQVTCVIPQEHLPTGDTPRDQLPTSVPEKSLAGACRLVDESIVETQNSKQARVTLIKWLKGKDALQ